MGYRISSVCGADDQVLITGMPNQLKIMMNRLGKEGKLYGMKINANKTKVMQVGGTTNSRPIRIKVDGVQI